MFNILGGRSQHCFGTLFSLSLILIVSFSFSLLASAIERSEVEVTGLNGRIESTKLFYKDEWHETGPITIKLADKEKLSVRLPDNLGKGTIMWPASISCPLFEEMRIEAVNTLFIGVLTQLEDGSYTSTDVSRINIAVPRDELIMDINNSNKIIIPQRLQGVSTGEFKDPTKEQFMREILPKLPNNLERAWKLWNEVMRDDVEVTSEFISHSVALYKENYQNELVLFHPKAGRFTTANLEGEFQIRLGRDS